VGNKSSALNPDQNVRHTRTHTTRAIKRHGAPGAVPRAASKFNTTSPPPPSPLALAMLVARAAGAAAGRDLE
jgi:hypothetical protein